MKNIEIKPLREHREIILLDKSNNIQIVQFISKDSNQVHKRRLIDIITLTSKYKIKNSKTINPITKEEILNSNLNINREDIVFGFESNRYLDSLYLGDLKSKNKFWRDSINFEYEVKISLKNNLMIKAKAYNIEEWYKKSINAKDSFVTLFNTNICPKTNFNYYLKEKNNIFGLNINYIKDIETKRTYAHHPQEIVLFKEWGKNGNQYIVEEE